MALSPEIRFFARVRPNSRGCWIWTGALEYTGYARWYVNGVRHGVHRWAYEHFKESIPEGLVIDHLCDTPACANPDHLRACTQRRNVLRSATAGAAINARKTSCVNGHPFDAANTYIGKYGRRTCRRCRANRENARRRRRAEQLLST